MRPLIFTCLLTCMVELLSAPKDHAPNLKLAGIMIWVDDLDKAENFYKEILGFQPAVAEPITNGLTLNSHGMTIYLATAGKHQKMIYEQDVRTAITIEVPKLLPAIDQLRNAGLEFEENHLQRNGVGISIPLHDPAGNLLNLIEVQNHAVAPFESFRVYNLGITSSGLDAARAFYIEKLGFEAWSFDYLPAALPLKHANGSFAFMLHKKVGLSNRNPAYGQVNDTQLVFHCADLELTSKQLESAGIETLAENEGLVCRDPFGNYFHIRQK